MCYLKKISTPLMNFSEACQCPRIPYNKFTRDFQYLLTTCDKFAGAMPKTNATFATGLPHYHKKSNSNLKTKKVLLI
jgi:hypothetical protein